MTSQLRRGFSIRIFLPDGIPDGLRVVERLLFLKGRGIEPRGYEAADGFVVLAGSQAAKDTVPSIQPYLVAQRVSLAERGILVTDGEAMRLSQDYTFDSPSAAAGVLLGRSVNGRMEWKDAEGRTLKQVQLSGDEEQPAQGV